MKIELEIDNIKQKLFDRLKPSGWDVFFKHYIFSSDFTNTLERLYKMTTSDIRFTPPTK